MHRQPPTAWTRRVCLVAPVLLYACGASAHQDQPFATVFADPTVLVTTDQPMAVRAQLSTVTLPVSDSHNERLLTLLRNRPQIRAAHLALLLRAIAAPRIRVVTRGEQRWTYGPRGNGPHAAMLEQLLLEGRERVTDVDARWLGELIGMTQQDTTLRAYADRFLAQVDDGSVNALAAILDGMPGSPAALPFLRDYLAPMGGIDGARGWLAFERMYDDDERLAVLQILLDRRTPIDGDRMLATMRSFTNDSAREQAVALLASVAKPPADLTSRALEAAFPNRSDRNPLAANAHQGIAMSWTDDQLVELVNTCSSDTGRLRCVQAIADFLHDTPTVANARALLTSFAYDGGRLGALRAMISRWQQLPATDRQSLLATFAAASSREEAATWLGR